MDKIGFDFLKFHQEKNLWKVFTLQIDSRIINVVSLVNRYERNIRIYETKILQACKDVYFYHCTFHFNYFYILPTYS